MTSTFTPLAPGPWQWHPFQQRVLVRSEYEIFCGGGKFGGKSAAARGFLIKGNPDLPDFSPSGTPILVNQSYLYHPNYRATILRRNQQDLDDFLRRFQQLVLPYGGRFTKGLFEFPSGAVVACGHLADRDAWQKYIGIENIRFVLEEAALVPDFNLFDQIRSCCRSVWPEMRAQILLTSNAGGPGTSWLVKRYYEAKDPSGQIIPPETTIHELVDHPDNPEIKIDKTRVFMFSTYRDNPSAKNDPDYVGTLATMQDPKIRAAYLDGDWKIFSGIYFTQFRPSGPVHISEPPNANHVIPSNPSLLRPWWHRWGAIDVGWTHETAVGWACRNPHSHQLHLYRELVASETSYVQIGFEIASRSLAELEALPSHAMTFYISPDAIKKVTEQKTIADLLMEGISRKLGPQAVHFPEEEVRKFRELQGQTFSFQADEDRKWADLLTKLKNQRKAGITLRMAMNDRVPGWQFCRESLRFTTIGDSLPPFDRQLYDQLYMDDPLRAEQYIRLYQHEGQEVLPMLQIWDRVDTLGPYYGCPRLIQAIPEARHADKPGENPEDVSKAHFLGMDSLDMWRYLMTGAQEVPITEPYEDYRDRMVNQFTLANPQANAQDLIQMNRQLEGQWKQEKAGKNRPFDIIKGSRARRSGPIRYRDERRPEA